MRRSLVCFFVGWSCTLVPASATADLQVVPAAAKAASPAKSPAVTAAKSPAQFALRYRFQPGETIRWKVVDQTLVETTVQGTTQTAEANTTSVTAWRIKSVEPDGRATFEYVVESVDMRQKVSGRMEMRYNSRTDKKPPAVFDAVAKTVGVPLTRVTLDAKGKVLKLEAMVGKPGAESQSRVAVPLPDRPVAVKESWSVPADVEVSLQDGTFRRIKTLESYTLEDVQDGVATIRVVTQVLTAINDPVVEAQVVQRESTGRVRFDVAAGRILARTIDVDKRVVGFAGHAASVMSYRTQFAAELLTDRSDMPAKAGPPRDEIQSAKRPTPLSP